MAQTFIRPSQVKGIPVGANIAMSLLQTNTEVALVNTIVETSLLSVTVPGGMLGTNDALYIEMQGLYNSTNAGSDNLTVRVKLGGTTLCTPIMQLNGAITNEGTFSRVWIKNVGSISSQKAFARIDEAFGDGGTPYGTGAVNTAVNQTLQVTAQFATALTNLTWTLLRASVFYMRNT